MIVFLTGTEATVEEIIEVGTDDDEDDDEDDDDEDDEEELDEEGAIELTFCILLRRRLNDSTFVC